MSLHQYAIKRYTKDAIAIRSLVTQHKSNDVLHVHHIALPVTLHGYTMILLGLDVCKTFRQFYLFWAYQNK